MNKDLKRATKNETGDFVVFEEEDVTSQTIRVTGEELDEIKKQSKNIDSDYDDYDEYESYDRYSVKSKKSTAYASDRKKDRQIVFAAVATALTLIVLITVIVFVFVLPKEEDVTVPDFIDKTWDEALKLAEEKQIYIKPDNENPEEYSDSIEKDHILDQNIQKGDTVKIGDTIYLVMSLGSDKIKVPNVVGHSLDEATAEFKDKKIKWEEKYDYSDDVKKDYVIRQEPESGEEISADSKVIVYISRGKESEAISVPDVIGYTEAAAKRELSRVGFEVDVRTVNSRRSAGQVVDQDFRDEKRETGTTVTIYVSNGDDDEEEPDNQTPEENNDEPKPDNSISNENNNDNDAENNNNDNNGNSDNSNQNSVPENPPAHPQNNNGDVPNGSGNEEAPLDGNPENGTPSEPLGGGENPASPNVDSVEIDPNTVA